MSRYEVNRAQVPREEFERCQGQWVAFSKDGSRILCGAATLGELEAALLAKGIDAQQVAFECIDNDDSYIGGAETL